MARGGAVYSQLRHDFNENETTLSQFLSIADSSCFIERSFSEGDGELVGFINTKLGTSRTRLEGLCLLCEAVQRCSPDALQKHALAWFGSVLKLFDSPSTLAVEEVLFHVIECLMEHTVGFPELSREISTTFMPQVLSQLLKKSASLDNPKAEGGQSVVECLAACMRHYPGSCGLLRNKLETFCISLIERNHTGAPECVARLSQIGGRGTQGSKHAETWRDLCDKLLGSIHTSLDTLYKGLADGFCATNVKEFGRLTLEPISDGGQAVQNHTERCITLAQCLARLLAVETSMAVIVPMTSIVQLVLRMSAVRGSLLLKAPTTTRLQLVARLDSIQTTGYHLLSALIHSCRSNLITHGSAINHLFLQTLNWTKCDSLIQGQNKPHRVLRSEVYNTLRDWLVVMKGASEVQLVCPDLVQLILHDCKPDSGGTFKPPKKGKGKSSASYMIGNQIGEFSGNVKSNKTANRSLCEAALTALNLLLHTNGHELSAETHKQIQQFVIHHLLELDQGPPYSVPYNSPVCQAALYELLLACTLTPCPTWPPPIDCAITLFSRGQNSDFVSVASVCLKALTVCESLIHPAVPPLGKPNVYTTEATMDVEQSPPAWQNDNMFSRGVIFPAKSTEWDTQPGQSNVNGVHFISEKDGAGTPNIDDADCIILEECQSEKQPEFPMETEQVSIGQTEPDVQCLDKGIGGNDDDIYQVRGQSEILDVPKNRRHPPERAGDEQIEAGSVNFVETRSNQKDVRFDEEAVDEWASDFVLALPDSETGSD